jgi:hypothetical protein
VGCVKGIRCRKRGLTVEGEEIGWRLTIKRVENWEGKVKGLGVLRSISLLLLATGS